MSLSTIKTALLLKLSQVTNLPTVRNEDENYKVANNREYPFIRPTMLSAEATPIDVSSNKQGNKGIFRCDIFGTRTLNTSIQLLAVAEQIIEAFRPQIINLTDEQIRISGSWMEAARYDAGVITVPVFVRWSSAEL
jgi:hypothetical protein